MVVKTIYFCNFFYNTQYYANKQQITKHFFAPKAQLSLLYRPRLQIPAIITYKIKLLFVANNLLNSSYVHETAYTLWQFHRLSCSNSGFESGLPHSVLMGDKTKLIVLSCAIVWSDFELFWILNWAHCCRSDMNLEVHCQKITGASKNFFFKFANTFIYRKKLMSKIKYGIKCCPKINVCCYLRKKKNEWLLLTS